MKHGLMLATDGSERSGTDAFHCPQCKADNEYDTPLDADRLVQCYACKVPFLVPSEPVDEPRGEFEQVDDNERGPRPPHIGDTVLQFKLRDYFAAMAMQGLLAHGPDQDEGPLGVGQFAAEAYAQADAMLEARRGS